MAKSQQSWNKREREKKKLKEKQDKADKMQERKASGSGSRSLEDMMAYIDENGNIVDTPPDPAKRKEISLDEIVIGVPKKSAEDDGATDREGIISFFNESKGYGFIRDLQSGESIFVHVNQVNGTLKENQRVKFETEKGHKGLQAVNVRIG